MKLVAYFILSAMAVLPANAADVNSAAKDVIGAWRLEFTSPDGVKRTPTVVVGRQHNELVAWYIESAEPEPFKDVRLKDDSLLLTIEPAEYNGDATVTVEARLKEDNVCRGAAKCVLKNGERESWDFSGRRLGESDFDDVTQWDLAFVAPDNQQQKATVTVVTKGAQAYAWYTSEDYDLPAKQMSVNGNDVVMSITAKGPDGNTIDATFRGSIAGDRVSGTAAYSVEGSSGTFPFSGKRKS